MSFIKSPSIKMIPYIGEFWWVPFKTIFLLIIPFFI